MVRELSEVNVDSPEEPTLPLTEACLKEGMRVKPVGPVVIRRALHGGHTSNFAAYFCFACTVNATGETLVLNNFLSALS